MTRRTKGGALVSQIHQVCSRVWAALLREEGLGDMGGARGRVLFVLWTHDCVPIRTLAEKTGLDKSTLTGVLDRLERDGYITRREDENDRRSFLVCRTGKDRFFEEKVPAVSDKMNGIFYRGFSDEEIAAVDGLLQRILDNCREADAARGK
ncbi:MarR family winged helix-turn-helix transcriptional regulator [Treponema brennaborense]|uniref:Transcriptional regulator, MarR family n=1 Tax=Treponema brennaborense (strain DSM 12168 / CIP 105900 / DD5/3) TaxID=906968 RepID=F4LKY7_TREBD|nr:MarR family transcriptional regulator [Treponema brennaborense]AEE16584.1 transcriptional regulator, MarR family [Treponema brennaborense DSM 12168]